MLKRIQIENYRSCFRTSIDVHPNLSVLIGPNGSGKTNILQAIMFLNRMLHERENRVSNHDASAVSSRIKVTFKQRDNIVRLNASVAAYTDESNNDVMLGSRQRWSLKSKSKKHVPFDLPLALARHIEYGPSGLRYFHRFYLRYQSRQGLVLPDKWAQDVLSRLSEFCEGIRYYGASQFTNPGSCPVSFEMRLTT